MFPAILALDLGGSKILSAIATVTKEDGLSHARLAGIARRTLRRESNRDDVWNAILSSVDETLASAGVALSEIGTIGATIPGVADPRRGYWIYAPFSGIRDFPIADELSAHYGKPVFADNDVNACAWGEKVFGVCQNVEDYLWITISNGIGGGLVLNGRVFPGKFSGAAEIGHFNVEEDGPKCGCGNHGCLEAVAAGPGIARGYRERIQNAFSGNDEIAGEWRRYLMQKYALEETTGLCDAESVELAAAETATALTIAEEARKGNPVALATWRAVGRYVGRAASWAANLINPEKIVVGGGVAGAFDLFSPAMQETFQKFLFKQTNATLTIEKTGLGYEAGLMGAASLAFDNPYKDETT